MAHGDSLVLTTEATQRSSPRTLGGPAVRTKESPCAISLTSRASVSGAPVRPTDRRHPVCTATGRVQWTGWLALDRAITPVGIVGRMTADDMTRAKGAELLRLHQDETLLTLVNVWDVVSAKTVAAVEGTTALATASHSIAAAFGYEDGENIPLDLMLEQVKRIVDSTDLPVTADLEGGYGDAPETIRRAIGLGVVGANIEDQLKPIAEAARQVEAIMKVAEEEGVDFVLNARTDAFSLNRKGDPAENLAVAIERGKAYLDAGAPVVFVPAMLNEDAILALVDAFGPAAADRRSASPASRRGTGSRSTASRARRTARCRRTSPSPRSRSWSRRCTAAAARRPTCASWPDRATQGRCNHGVRRCCHDHTQPPRRPFLAEISAGAGITTAVWTDGRHGSTPRSRTGGSSATAPRPSRPSCPAGTTPRPPSSPRSGARSPAARPSSST